MQFNSIDFMVFFPLTASPSGTGMVFDREALETVPDGVSILVYDAVTQARAAFLTFDAAASG